MTRTLGNQDPDEVLAIAAQLEGEINTIPGPVDGDYTRHRAECRKAIADLATRRIARAMVRETPQGASITMLGLRAGSTAGFVGAARNWIRQAREKAQNTKGQSA